jgi:hypothetical protein
MFFVLSCCRALLQRGSVSLVPGGIAEMFLWEANREAIKVGWVWEGPDQVLGESAKQPSDVMATSPGAKD